MDSEARSREARARAERALIELALAFGDHADELIVIGGLNPDFLTPDAPVQHLGTTDVDILLELGFVWDRDDLDFSWLEPALRAGGFEPRSVDAWQWLRVDDDSLVRVDLLCDVMDSPDQSIALPGAEGVTAKNLAGPSGALVEPVTRGLDVDDVVRRRWPDAPSFVTLRFASLGGYLLAKASALTSRHLEKDSYDLMYVIQFNPGGPDGAAEAIRSALEVETVHHRHGLHVRSALQSFVTGNSSERFARQMVLSGDTATTEQLVLDARRGAERVLARLG